MTFLKEYCSGCGKQTLVQHSLSHIQCSSCSKEIFLNPVPVAVAVVKNQLGSLLLTKRKIEPKKGFFCLPAGFQVIGETVEAAASRELLEETGIAIPPHEFTLFSVSTTPDARRVLMFYEAFYDGELSYQPHLFNPNDEVDEIRWASQATLFDVDHAFPLHLNVCTQVLKI